MTDNHKQKWVVKVGSALLSNPDQGLNRQIISSLARDVADLKDSDISVVLVSSGSIAEGIQRLGWLERPHELQRLQAAAAVGQMGLIEAYENAFRQFSIQTAQVLLTDADIADRARYLNARAALKTLLELGIVPVVNENDTVVTQEIKFGDNDTLAALVANLIDAQYLVILTDQDGLFDEDPRINKSASLIREDVAGNPKLKKFAGKSGSLGRGGMVTKVRAAEIAGRSGTSTVIASGKTAGVLQLIRAGKAVGTLLKADTGRIAARKQWLAGQLRVKGSLYLDSGAANVLCESGRSLLAVGVERLDGEFSRGELVSCLHSKSGLEIARGLVNYSSHETAQILGHSSKAVEGILGYMNEPELINRDNIVILQQLAD
jgi:glutamate 5-kinase